MTAYECPETPEECDPVDSRGLLSHLANGHFEGDYDRAREVRENTELVPYESDESAPESDPGDETTDGPTDAPDAEQDAESGDGAADSEPSASTPEASDPTTDEPGDSERSERDHDPSSEHAAPVEETEEIGGEEETETDGGTDGLSVGHEGREKLEPENAPGGSKTNIPSPDGVPDDVDADALEGEPVEETADRDHDPADEQDADDDGGLLGKIRGGSSRSSEEIVEDSDDPEERQRKEELRDQLTEAVEQGGETVPDETADEPEETTDRTAGGVRVDSSMVESVIGMPFNAASAATGFDGWELSAQERKDNAELFVAVCEEHDVDLGPTVLLALSMGGTATSKAVQYKKWKESQQDEESDAGRERDASATRDREDTRDTEPAQTAAQTAESDPATDGGMNPNDPSTW